MTRNVVVYMKPDCPFSQRAMRLLDIKGVPYRQLDVSADERLWREMIQRSGGQESTPQVFADGEHLGDCEALVELDHTGRLEPRLGLSDERWGS